MARILITGGAGFIGSNLADALQARGDEVVVYDDFSSGRRENLAHLEGKIRVVVGDVKELDDLRAAIAGCDYVLHQAAVPSVPRSMEDPLGSHEANSRGTLNVLLAARDAGVKRVVFAASSSAYGESPTLPKIETMLPAPKSPYAADKLHGEHLCQVFHTGYGLETVALRYFNVFGPRQNPNSDYAAAIPRFVTRILDDQSPIVFGDGEQSRDFTHIDNVVQANLKAMAAPGAPGRVFNVGIGARITVNELIRTIGEILGKSVTIDYQPARVGDVLHSLASIDLARQHLGYEPTVDLAEGLRRTIDWYRASEN
ncbi:MAG: SDR family oxidoreductase [Planctomycetes bacterium]|nr:SDR family oxidoreductase [Planctomycetota bacterium]